MYEAFKGIGFVSIVNHGLDQRLVDGAFAQSKAFFALDAKAKASVAWTSAEANRGYLGVGKEMLCVLLSFFFSFSHSLSFFLSLSLSLSLFLSLSLS